MEINPTWVGLTAGVFTALSLLPQLVKIIKEKKAEDISMLMLGVLFTGIALWIWYGALKKDIPILVTNGISIVLNVLIIIFSIKYKKKS
ncbi:MAG: SemiSWEET transporter [Bacteroidota bacterium]|nr:SemiSWEET transporter [Bacteroidota bacterium]